MIAEVSLILFLSVFVAGVSVFLFKNNNKSFLKIALSFSGAFLFTVSVTHLLPEIYQKGDHTIGLYILGGFFFQILLEFFSEGIEHGHIHIHKEHNHSFPVSIIASLSIHSFLEAMPLANETGVIENSLLFGIVLHNLPVSFAFSTMLLQSGVRKNNTLILLIAFALVAPAGLFCAKMLTTGDLINSTADYSNKIMAVVVGIFLHISTTILFESTENHRFNLYKMAAILFGAALAIIALT